MNQFVRSFVYALKGIYFAVRNEKNFQIEIIIGGCAVVLALLLSLSGLEQGLIILSVALVLTLELANTALERVIDILKPRVHPYARIIKDMMAGAVLLASLAALAIGLAIFVPYMIVWFSA
ncbi:MAG TPA: diacylglycerol kinase [Patescibacteria group bacterium]|nr:diacylglycerol kinase [Patescibacteria group bacterium]